MNVVLIRLMSVFVIIYVIIYVNVVLIRLMYLVAVCSLRVRSAFPNSSAGVMDTGAKYWNVA